MHLGRIDNTPSYRKHLWIFFLVAAVFLVFIFDYSLSRVTVKIFPQSTQQTISLSASLDQKVAAANADKMLFPAKVAERDVSLEQAFPTTGIESQDDFAKGEITITSKREKDIPLPKGYKVIKGEGPVDGEPWKNKIIFELDNDILIPSGGTITTTVTAINKGARGNIEAGPMYFASMATWNRERLLPKNDKAFTGGVIETKIVSEADTASAKEALIKASKKEAATTFAESLASDKAAREELTYVYVGDFSVSNPVGQSTEKITAKLAGKAKTIIIPIADIKEALKKKIALQYSASDLMNVNEDSFKITVKSMDLEAGKAEIEAALSGVFAPKFSSDVFEKKNLVGFNENAIKQRYATDPNIQKIEVNFFPFWRKTVPSLEEHVFVEIVK